MRELWKPSLFDPNYSLTKYHGTVSFIGSYYLQLFNKCLFYIFKASSVEQDRDLAGFNLLILIFSTPLCCVNSFISESEIQRSQPATANQTPQTEHSDSIKLHPANQTRWDEQKLHSAEIHVMAERNQGEYWTFSNRISHFSGRSCIVLLTLFYKNFGQSDGRRRIEYNFLVRQVKGTWIIIGFLVSAFLYASSILK